MIEYSLVKVISKDLVTIFFNKDFQNFSKIFKDFQNFSICFLRLTYNIY